LKTKLILAALFLLLVVSIAAPLQAKDSQPKLVIDITRSIRAGQYGVIHVTDQFNLFNNATTPMSSLDFAFARIYRDNVHYMDAKDAQGRSLSIETDVNKTSNFYWIRAHFAQELAFNKTYNFTVSSVMYGLTTVVSTGFDFNFTAAPVLTQDARLANVTYFAPPATSFQVPENSSYISATVAGQPVLIREFKPWKAYSNETFLVPYATVNQFFLDFQSSERDIILSTGGSLSIKDSYKIHDPSVPVGTLTVSLPEGASNVMAYDNVGAMWATPENPAPPYSVTVTPRYSSGIRAGENFTFTLTYNVPQSKYLKQMGWWGSYNLTFALFNNRDDYFIKNSTVRISTPSGVTIRDPRIPPQSPLSDPIQVAKDERTFSLSGVTNMDNLTFGATVDYSPFWSAFEFLPWILGFEILIVAFAGVTRLQRRPELKVPVPVEKLREFVGLYDERLALSRELVVMEEDVARGALVKHEFRRRSKVMELRLDEVNKSLMEVKAELRTISAHYDDLIRRIDRAEAEIGSSRASLNQVRGQYRAGKTTRETYDTLVNDIEKRIDRAEETVETILITLREEAR
jgi:hypothetical protein